MTARVWMKVWPAPRQNLSIVAPNENQHDRYSFTDSRVLVEGSQAPLLNRYCMTQRRLSLGSGYAQDEPWNGFSGAWRSLVKPLFRAELRASEDTLGRSMIVVEKCPLPWQTSPRRLPYECLGAPISKRCTADPLAVPLIPHLTAARKALSLPGTVPFPLNLADRGQSLAYPGQRREPVPRLCFHAPAASETSARNGVFAPI